VTGRIDSEPASGAGPLVVLLCDPGWPGEAGVCCWRHWARESFAVAGATVEEIVAPQSLIPTRLSTSGRPVVRAARRAIRRARDQAILGGPQGRRFAARLRNVDLVLAESPAVAELALAVGAEGRTVWTLALPPHHPAVKEDGPILGLAPRIAGFIAIDESGRESVERAVAATLRPRVEIFSAVSPDRPCPSCAGFTGAPPREVAPDRAALATARWPRHAVPQLSGWAGGPADPPAQPETSPGATTADLNGSAARVVAAVWPGAATGPRSRQVLVSGFDLKFARELAARLDSGHGLRVRLDEWPGIRTPSGRTRSLAEAADTVVAEWARPNAGYFAQHKRPGQTLIVRLHRYELTTLFPSEIDIDRVDAVVYVSQHVGREITERLGWPKEKLIYIPNYVDIDALDRPKLPGARFCIGAIGIELANKRFDLMLDIVAEVRRQDPRFTLFVRTTPPWENRYGWARADERAYVDTWLRRIDGDPLLRGGVVFDPPGRDMARWYRGIGIVLSTSDIEGFHFAVADGMASGAVPVIRPRPGAEEVFGPEWISGTTDEAVSATLEFANEDVWARHSALAKERIRHVADPAAVLAAWSELLHGDVTAARRRTG
jgi:glycosyltransferase involved in cell wall biosynthesis